jgi:very-short-patch-repair endonuclease
MSKIHNIRKLKENRKILRNKLTPAEAKLWSLLKNSQFENKKFRRQHSVGPYVLDFYCPSEKLCIELDGDVHFTDSGYEYDEARTEFLKSLNIRVIRFENKAVFENTVGVLEEIRRRFIQTNHLYLSLTREGRFGGTKPGW